MPPRCDFCAEPEIAWWHPARDIETAAFGLVLLRSIGRWAACDPCHALIEGGDRAGLDARADRYYATRLEMDQALRLRVIQASHAAFWRSREGPATPFTV